MSEALSFRLFLQEELLQRCRQNPRYSLRAFAKFLRIEPSALSKILRGQRKITTKTFTQLAERLDLSSKERSNFGMANSGTRENEFEVLKTDTFEAISQWYYFAILELTHTAGFEPDPRYIATRLGISLSEANIAIERLFRLGFLKTMPSGKWVDVMERISMEGMEKDAAIARRNFQRQLLELSLRALDEVEPPKRNHSATTFAMNPEMLEKASEEIKKFRRKLSGLIQASHPKREVYQLVISLFPLTKEETTTRRSS